MTSGVKPNRMGKPARKRLKRKNDDEGIQRLQQGSDPSNAEQGAEINHSTSTPAKLDEDGISPSQHTTRWVRSSRSGHASTMLEDSGAPNSGVLEEPSEQIGFGAQRLSLAPEGLHDDMTDARGFSRLSGLLDQQHLIYPAVVLTCQNQSTEQLRLLSLVKERLQSSWR